MELTPCPFCGSLRVLVVSYAVRCGDCGACGPFGLTDEDAIRRWSGRPADAQATGQQTLTSGGNTVRLQDVTREQSDRPT